MNMKKFVFGAIVALGLVSGTNSVQARDAGSLYLSGGLKGSIIEKKDISSFETAINTPDFNIEPKALDFKMLKTFFGEIGYVDPDTPRVGVEFGYASAELKSKIVEIQYTSGDNTISIPINEDIDTMFLLANFYYDFVDTGLFLAPYIGVGMGMMMQNLKTIGDDVARYSMAFQLKLGATFPVTEGVRINVAGYQMRALEGDGFKDVPVRSIGSEVQDVKKATFKIPWVNNGLEVTVMIALGG